MIVYRISRKKYARDLSGKGAEIAGGRWNSKGIPVIYTAESRALCALELAAHVNLALLPKDFVVISIELPEQFIKSIQESKLPKDWDSIPNGHQSQLLGDFFVNKMKYLALKVPSAIVPQEYNYVINPRHRTFNAVKIIKIEDFNFDQRLIERR